MSPKYGDEAEIFEKKILKGKPIIVADRTIYPVVQVSTLEIEGIFWFETIIPLAMAILDTGGKYLVPLGSEESEEYKKSEEYKIYQSLEIDELLD